MSNIHTVLYLPVRSLYSDWIGGVFEKNLALAVQKTALPGPFVAEAPAHAYTYAPKHVFGQAWKKEVSRAKGAQK
uniref:Uncharacterized protein n=1 Tax=Meiothermus ruber TaxID=277 RepID=A0A7C3HEA0_MEIRU